MKQVIDFFIRKPARFFFLAALFWGGLMAFFDLIIDKDKFELHDLLVEANGLFFDLLVFGILLSIYDSLRQKRERIERYQDEINDLRGWDDKEALHRIVGAIRRLNKEKHSSIYLYKSYLLGAELDKMDLSGADISYGNLNQAKLNEAKLINADLHCTELNHADLRAARLDGANLRYAKLLQAKLEHANLNGAKLNHADLRGADLSGADLGCSDLRDADLTGADLSDSQKTDFNKSITVQMPTKLASAKVEIDWFDKLERWNVKGRQEIIQKYEIDAEGILRQKQGQLVPQHQNPNTL